jgi:hypothetical protein
MRSLIATLLVLLSVAPAAAKDYSAERFDVRILMRPGGGIEVVETVVFRFESGTFEHVFREIPTRRTDGVEILSAAMDGRDLEFGEGTGQVEVERGSPVKVRWRFAPRSGTSHVFVLRYLVSGVVRKDAGADVLEWIALPTKHDYRIDTSEVIVEAPAPLVGTPAVDVRHVGEHSVEPASARVQVVARTIGKNGWIKTRLGFAEGAIIAAAPVWQERQIRADAYAPRWWMAAGVILVIGAILLFALRQRYESPSRAFASSSRTFDSAPDDLRPALAGALASNGNISLQHAMATLFTLADRGAVVVDEEPRRWGQHGFVVRHRAGAVALKPEESTLLDLAFPSSDSREAGVPLAKVRSRIASNIRKYRTRVREELRVLGLFDDDRSRVRNSFAVCGFALLLVALALVVFAAVMSGSFGGWPFLLPVAAAIVAIASFVFHGALTPLTNEGVRRADEWRAYGRHLKEVARDRAAFTARSPAALLPFAVALGLAGHWSKFVKQRPAAVPEWFRSLKPNDDGAFPAFIAVGGSGDVGGAGGGGGGGGAAGGGASGAG